MIFKISYSQFYFRFKFQNSEFRNQTERQMDKNINNLFSLSSVFNDPVIFMLFTMPLQLNSPVSGSILYLRRLSDPSFH